MDDLMRSAIVGKSPLLVHVGSAPFLPQAGRAGIPLNRNLDGESETGRAARPSAFAPSPAASGAFSSGGGAP